MSRDFFAEQADHSEVKSAIVATYFKHWAKVITGYLKGKNKDTTIQYIDLFAGPGRYKDGAKSTPLLILEEAIKDPLLRENLATTFNDVEPESISSLVAEIKRLPGIETLKYKPEVTTEEVGEKIVRTLEGLRLVPTLFFVDPWGYKGLSLRLINSVLKDWACECIFFFNYGRINAGLSNSTVKEHMHALFGPERGETLRVRLEPLSPEERELTIVEEICNALIDLGGKYTLPFGFKNASGTRTKHHLIFVSKDPLGYKIMKGVMATQSSIAEQGVPTFEYSPASVRQPLLFELAKPLDALEEMLLQAFAGRRLTMDEIYEQHNYGRRYIDKNYKDVLTKMEIAGKIVAEPAYSSRPKRKGEITCAGRTVFTFPKVAKT
jgi:three-Cys-motif partner protein